MGEIFDMIYLNYISIISMNLIGMTSRDKIALLFADKKLLFCKMEISIQNLWIVYFAILVGLALIWAVIVARSETNAYSVATLLSAIIAALTVYLIVYYNIDENALTAQDKSSLQALYLSALVIIVLAFIWCIIDLAMRSSRRIRETLNTHVEMECKEDLDGDLECEVTDVEVTKRDKNGNYSNLELDCVNGACSPSSFFLKTKDRDTININYMA
jgi:hypothetical protein